MKASCLVTFLAVAGPAIAGDLFPPAPPASIQAEYVPHYVTLDWTASPSADVAFYRVYQSPFCNIVPQCPPIEIKGTIAATDPLTFTGPYGEMGLDGPLQYGVAAVDTAGNPSQILWPTTVGVEGTLQGVFVFASPAPNPSRGEVAFSWTMPAAGPVRLAIVDLAGRTLRLVAGGQRAAGPQRVTWDGRDARGQLVRPGAYFAKLDSPWGSRSRMLVRTN